MSQPPVPQPTSSTRRKFVGSNSSGRTPPIPAVTNLSCISRRAISSRLLRSWTKYVLGCSLGGSLESGMGMMLLTLIRRCVPYGMRDLYSRIFHIIVTQVLVQVNERTLEERTRVLRQADSGSGRYPRRSQYRCPTLAWWADRRRRHQVESSVDTPRQQELRCIGQFDRIAEVVDTENYVENCVGFTGWTLGFDTALANFEMVFALSVHAAHFYMNLIEVYP